MISSKKLTFAIAVAGVTLAFGAVAWGGGVTPIPPSDYVEGCTPQDGVALQGGGGDDVMTGTPQDDLLRGGGGDDTITGLAGDDCLQGQKGSDEINGDDDDDKIKGNKGQDKITPGQEEDNVKAGKANDNVKADDGDEDQINCGGGKNDKATVDKNLDHVKKCEKVTKVS